MTLTGMDGLIRALKAMPETARAHLKYAVEATAFSIAQRMRATAPRASGVLIQNITTSTRGLSGRVEIGVDPFYWHFLEFGTVKMQARPFIRPSAELEAPIFEKRLRDVAAALEREFERKAA